MIDSLTPSKALDVLSFWTTLEVLCYQPFREPKDFVGKNKQKTIFTWGKILPWQNYREKHPTDKEVFYEIVLGAIDVANALTMLYDKYKNPGEEFSPPDVKSPLATIMTDDTGCVVRVNVYDADRNVVKVNALAAVSSFAWGAPKHSMKIWQYSNPGASRLR